MAYEDEIKLYQAGYDIDEVAAGRPPYRFRLQGAQLPDGRTPAYGWSQDAEEPEDRYKAIGIMAIKRLVGL